MDYSHIKVLVIDDEFDFVNLSKIALSKDFKVIEATTGEEGLSKVDSEDPDIVILDLNLPGINGYEVCRRIRQRYSFKDLPVLMLTVRTLDADYVTGFSCGADDYLTKPFERKELLARVINLLKKSGKV